MDNSINSSIDYQLTDRQLDSQHTITEVELQVKGFLFLFWELFLITRWGFTAECLVLGFLCWIPDPFSFYLFLLFSPDHFFTFSSLPPHRLFLSFICSCSHNHRHFEVLLFSFRWILKFCINMTFGKKKERINN